MAKMPKGHHDHPEYHLYRDVQEGHHRHEERGAHHDHRESRGREGPHETTHNRGREDRGVSGGDAAEMRPKLIPNFELLPRDDSGGPEWQPYTQQWGDGGYVTGEKLWAGHAWGGRVGMLGVDALATFVGIAVLAIMVVAVKRSRAARASIASIPG